MKNEPKNKAVPGAPLNKEDVHNPPVADKPVVAPDGSKITITPDPKSGYGYIIKKGSEEQS
jgi:hypothetical protein